MNILLPFVLLALLSTPVHAQTIDDGIMMGRHELCTVAAYTHDSWDTYWEGARERTNGNIGTLTTRTEVWAANYGLTDRLNVLTIVPYVRTRASLGVLRSMQGFQDITLAAKFNAFERRNTRIGRLRAIVVGSVGLPMTDYTPDFYPLSIGSASTRLSGRFTLNVQSEPGWFANGSTAYAWRSNVTLDRPYYFTDGQLFLTDDVDMPNVFDYVLSAGYRKRRVMASFVYAQQRTLGGGDIRRQDMPFVSNRMNLSRIGAEGLYPLPKLRGLAVQAAFARTVSGRNVGQATTYTAGVQYQFRVYGRPTP